jgi:hypothetical protein
MDKIAFKFNPEDLTGIDIPKENRKRASDEVARAVIDYILDYVGEGKSPVSGGAWKKKLTQEYEKKKKDESGVNFANLESSGALLDSLEARVARDGTIEVGIFESSQVGKADGHNNFSGKSELPTRQFIPKKNQTFKQEIIRGLREIMEEYKE